MKGDAEQLAVYVRSLKDFTFTPLEGEPYDHMGAVIADATLQAGVRYATVVKPRIDALLFQHPNATTTSAFLALLASETPAQLLTWKPSRKTETVLALTLFFQQEGVESVDDLRAWINSEVNRDKLLQIKGIGPKTVDYIQLIIGLQAVAIDRHLTNFIERAGVVATTYDARRSVVEQAARHMNVDASIFEHSIWLYMSKR